MKPRFRALYEDRSHEQWLRGLVDLARIPARDLTLEPKAQSGSGEQWVRERFPVLLKEHRSLKNAQRSLWLVVVADADLQDRARILREAIANAGLDPVSPDDRVLLLIPARNIETWAWCLLDHTVDETTDYKHEVEHTGIRLRDLVKAQWPTVRTDEPSSLTTARAEWKRAFT